jgi:hypothetical protein
MNGFAEYVARSAGHDGQADRPGVRDDSPLLRKIAAEAKASTGRADDPATDPREVTVHTIVQMARAFPGMDPSAASRLLHEADQAQREGASAADTLGVFLAEVRNPITGVLEAAARYRVVKLAHRVYRVVPEAEEE